MEQECKTQIEGKQAGRTLVCQPDACTGCMACLEVCGKDAITIEDTLRAYNAVIDPEKCIDCGVCHKVCQNNGEIPLVKPISWYQGWTEDTAVREASSSGGFATALEKSFIMSGGIVCSCVFENGEFRFGFAESSDEIKKFVGSKYVKSTPKGIYKKITALLKEGRKVLFVGLPCQVGALKKYVPEKYEGNLYTADLICHGTPSPQCLEMFLEQYGINLRNLDSICFRRKGKFRLEQNERAIVTPGTYDRYTLAFLNTMSYTENCYHCRYARLERVSDITLGDSWGSELAQDEVSKGISLALCQTEKGEELLKNSGLHLEDVGLENAIAHNHQLEHPSIKPQNYNMFWEQLGKGISFNKAVGKVLPKTCRNQEIKKILIKLKIARGGVPYQVIIKGNGEMP